MEWGERNSMWSTDMKYQFNKILSLLVKKKMLENFIYAPIWVCLVLILVSCLFIYLFIIHLFIYYSFIYLFLKDSALLDVRHYHKLQSCTISRKFIDANLRKWEKNLILDPGTKPNFVPNFGRSLGPKKFFCRYYLY